MRLGPPPEVEEAPGQFWKDFIRDTAPVFRTPTIEQLASFIQPTWQALLDGARYVHPRLSEIIDELAPDVICEDNVSRFPALPASGRPWVRIVSCNPAEIKDADVPPVFSGLRRRRPGRLGGVPGRVRAHAPAHVGGVRRLRAASAARPALPDLEFIHAIAVAEPVRLPGRGRLPAGRARWASAGSGWSRACARSDADFRLPESLRGGDGALVYLSLGSLGSADVV